MTEQPESDRGIFSTASPDQWKAMVAYAGEHNLCRGIVSVKIIDLGSYSFDEFPTTIDGAIGFFEKAREQAPREYRDQLQVRLNYENGYRDSGDSAELRIWYDRPETDDEMRARFNKYLDYIRRREAEERAGLARLKAKYEGST